MSVLEKMDRYLDSFKEGKSAMVDSWFMMSSPKPILSVVILYVLFIWLGPRVMKNREPLRITKLISYYNASQVVLATMICYKVLSLNVFRDGILYAGCRYASNTLNPMLLETGWWYFFAKLSELLDTVFFVLRKKNKQITFLHVYHHAIMALYSWSYLKFAAGGEGSILALLNSMVHVVMYSYYLLSGLGPKFQKYLWWKKHVTKMQLGQFILMLVYCGWTYHLPRCQYAVGFTYFISINVTIFLVLFLNFYIKSYKNKLSTKEFKETENSFNICKPILNNCANEENHERNNYADNNSASMEEVPYEINKACGDYVKDGKVFITRRTARAAFGSDYEFTCLQDK